MNRFFSRFSGLSFQIFILAAFVLIVFYPTIHAEISLIDDTDMLSWLSRLETGVLHQILVPGNANGGYYRPLIGASFWLDKLLFNANPVIMHLEGVLLHLVNVLLVLFLTRVCLGLTGLHDKYLLPFCAALLFGVHPITTESVNWISGRTDILMGNFILLGAILLILFKRSGRIRYLISALLAVLLAALAKEAAIGCLAGGVLLCTARVSDSPSGPEISGPSTIDTPQISFTIFYGIAFLAALILGNYWIVLACFLVYWALAIYRQANTGSLELKKQIRTILIILSIASVSLVLFFLMRNLVFTSSSGKIGNTVRLMLTDTNYSISLFIGAFGFYIQKFIFPWPLNFFILEIDPLYDFAGIAVVLVIMRLLTKNTIRTALYLVGIGLVLPVLPFVFGTIAWTSYAERYIYLPSAFWCVALAVQSAELLGMKCFQRPCMKWTLMVLFPVLLVTFATTSRLRNLVWQKNVTLLQDTVGKSPKVKPLRDFYMAALFNAGRFDEAAEQYEIGKSLYSRIYDPAPDLIMGMILRKRGKNDAAYQLYEKTNLRTGYVSEQSLLAMLHFLESFTDDSTFMFSKPEIRQQILRYHALLDQLHAKPAPGNLNSQKREQI